MLIQHLKQSQKLLWVGGNYATRLPPVGLLSCYLFVPGLPGESQKRGHRQSAEEDRGTVPGHSSSKVSKQKFNTVGFVQPLVGDILGYLYTHTHIYV